MNILFITAFPFTPQLLGGLQTSTTELALFLKKNGHEVSVLCELSPVGWTGFRSRCLLKLPPKKKAAPDTTLGFPVWRAWHPLEALEWLANRIKPDLVIVLAGPSVKFALAARAIGLPVLLMLQDVWFHNHAGDFTSLGKNVPCVANSQFTAARYRQAFGVEPSIIPPLIDGKKKYGTETTRENVTFINPIPLKGLELAMKIASECPDIPFSFVEGWYVWKDVRLELLKKLAAVPNITLHRSEQDMRKVYSKCKILLAPSICEEAYGRVATEAQFSGIPVVASNRGGLPEAVGQGGVLLDPEGDIQEWSAAIKKLWNDEAYYAELSAAAQVHADRSELKWESQSSLWEKIIEEASRLKPPVP